MEIFTLRYIFILYLFILYVLPGVQQSPGIVYCHLQVRDHFSRSCPLLFSGSFLCVFGTEDLYTHSLWEVVEYSRSKMHETRLIMFGLAESALTQVNLLISGF